MKKNLKLDIFTFITIVFGLYTVYEGVQLIGTESSLYSVLFFVFLSFIADSFTIEISQGKYVSLGFAVSISAILLFDPFIAATINFVGTIISVYFIDGKYMHLFNTSAYKRLFNGSSYAISALIAGASYVLIRDAFPQFTYSGLNVPGIFAAITANTLSNVIIFIILYALIDSTELKVVTKELFWVTRNFVGISPLGVIMAFLYLSHGWFMVALIFGPLLVARYSFKLYLDMKNQYFETIKTLSNALDAKDEYTNGHSHRVAQISTIIAKEMKIPVLLIDEIKTAAILHDIGKIGISDAIINKPGRLEDHEMAIIQKHPEIGANIVKDVKSLEDLSNYIRYHHERYDGKGYPEGIAGSDIPIEAAIIAVSDCFDAMTSDRVYRKAMSFEIALSIIKEERGKQFHPGVVDAFVRCADNGQIPKTHEMM